MKTLLILLFFVFSIMFVVPSYALNLENKILVSDDEDLIIGFADNTVRPLLTKTIITPNLDFGIIRLIDQDILLESSDNVSVTVLGRSIAVIAYDVPVVIYARNMGDDNFSINLYTVENGKFIKHTFTATLESEIVIPTKSEIVEEVVTEPLINVLTSYYQKVVEGEPFVFVVKTFDINKYDGSDWGNFYGKLDGVTIHAEILGLANQVLKTVDGVTENGVFKGQVIVPENSWPQGWYTLSLNAFYKGDSFNENLKFFVQSFYVTSGNKAPIANAGPDQSHTDGVGGFSLGVSVITLDGTSSTDPDGDSLTFSWTQTEGDPITLSDSTTEQPTFTPTITDVYVFQLTVSDPKGKSSSDTVTITIT